MTREQFFDLIREEEKRVKSKQELASDFLASFLSSAEGILSGEITTLKEFENEMKETLSTSFEELQKLRIMKLHEKSYSL